MKPTITLRKITPAIAERMLKNNTANRPIVERKLKQYSKDMREDKWLVTNDAITFNTDGSLSNGQHRLMAIVETGITVECFVAEGLDPLAFEVMDTGATRTAAHCLSLLGEKNTNMMAAALVLIERYFKGGMATKQGMFTNTEILELLSKYPDIRISAQISHLKNLKKLVHGSASVALHYLFSQKDKELADSFMDQLSLGSNIGTGTPVYLLRERLMENALSKKKYTKEFILAICIKAWNATRKNKAMKQLNFNENESFPIID